MIVVVLLRTSEQYLCRNITMGYTSLVPPHSPIQAWMECRVRGVPMRGHRQARLGAPLEFRGFPTVRSRELTKNGSIINQAIYDLMQGLLAPLGPDITDDFSRGSFPFHRIVQSPIDVHGRHADETREQLQHLFCPRLPSQFSLG
jgi:hypothetical protein